MNIREMGFSDRDEIDDLYERFFSHIEYPDFLDKNDFRCPFVVTEETDSSKVLLAGGIKVILEAVVVTDKNESIRKRQEALLQAMGSVVRIAGDMGYEQVHVFVANDDQYVKHLQKFGFKLMDAKLLVLNIGEQNGKASTSTKTSTIAD